MKREFFLTVESISNKATMNSLSNKLQKTSTNDIPFLFPGTGHDALGESCFEIMIQ